MLRHAFDLRAPNALYDWLLHRRLMRAAARTIFYHHRGLFSPEAWRDAVLAMVR